MKLLWRYLVDYMQHHAQIKCYLVVLLFLFSCILVNYYFEVENRFVNVYYGSWKYHAALCIFYISPFLIISLVIGWFDDNFSWMSEWHFWAMLLIGINILAFDGAFAASKYLPGALDWPSKLYLSRIIEWSRSTFTVVLPIMLISIIARQKEVPRYFGLSKGVQWSAYLQILIPVLCIIFLGSFSSDLQQYYPRYIRSGYDLFADQYELPYWLTLIVYQIAYGIDFIGVELIFRGFFVWAFVRYFGAQAVLPMVGVYAFLHFGKPATEAISSIFGGFFLGIVSYQSRNIWGGVVLHVGVAWSMELFGYFHRIW